MKAVAPWVYIRFIPGRLEAQGFFTLCVLIESVTLRMPIDQYIMPARRTPVSGRQTPRQTNTLSRHLHSAFPAHPDPFPGCHAACIATHKT